MDLSLKNFSFQAESPSTNQLSALSVYLLTCLFFVGCAILEFAYLLHRSRSNERRMDYKKMKQFPEKMYIVEEVKSSRDQNVEEEYKGPGVSPLQPFPTHPSHLLISSTCQG